MAAAATSAKVVGKRAARRRQVVTKIETLTPPPNDHHRRYRHRKKLKKRTINEQRVRNERSEAGWWNSTTTTTTTKSESVQCDKCQGCLCKIVKGKNRKENVLFFLACKPSLRIYEHLKKLKAGGIKRRWEKRTSRKKSFQRRAHTQEMSKSVQESVCVGDLQNDSGQSLN